MFESDALLDNRYKIEGQLDKGGMGAVFLAQDQQTGEQVAVKALHDTLSRSDTLRERFEREARALFAMRHPHIVRMIDFGIAEGRAYIVTELLIGESLNRLIEREEQLDPTRALAIAQQVLKALAFAHAQGIAHRDMKAANIFVSKRADGVELAKLLDFGLVRFLDIEQWGASASLTTDGQILGSPGYISPEQALGHRGDMRSDVYSTGVILFELLTGSWPFMAEDQKRLFRAHLSQPVPALALVRPNLVCHPDLIQLVHTALAKPPGDRFKTGIAMLSAFNSLPVPAARI